jgi:hypothetical protein
VYDKPIANIILNRENLKPFLLKLGKRQWCLLLTLIYYSVGIPSQSNKTRDRHKMDLNREGRNQIIPFADV